MRRSIPALAVLLALDGALYGWLSRASTERTALAHRRAELDSHIASLHESEVHGREIDELVRTAAASMEAKGLDIAELRTLLIRAERGLEIDRLSLDFRPAQEGPKGGEGGRVGASLEGTFDAVDAYLDRVESMRLPLAAHTFSLSSNDFSRVLLAIEWNGRWSLPEAAPEDLAPSDVVELRSWLAKERSPRIAHDLFSAGEASSSPESTRASLAFPAPATTSGDKPYGDASPLPRPAPRLTGFVIARPEVEKNVDRRVLAALRFEGELRLVAVGDTLGGYQVEAIDARESVVLVDRETGERLKLSLE